MSFKQKQKPKPLNIFEPLNVSLEPVFEEVQLVQTIQKDEQNPLEENTDFENVKVESIEEGRATDDENVLSPKSKIAKIEEVTYLTIKC